MLGKFAGKLLRNAKGTKQRRKIVFYDIRVDDVETGWKCLRVGFISSNQTNDKWTEPLRLADGGVRYTSPIVAEHTFYVTEEEVLPKLISIVIQASTDNKTYTRVATTQVDVGSMCNSSARSTIDVQTPSLLKNRKNVQYRLRVAIEVPDATAQLMAERSPNAASPNSLRVDSPAGSSAQAGQNSDASPASKGDIDALKQALDNVHEYELQSNNIGVAAPTSAYSHEARSLGETGSTTLTLEDLDNYEPSGSLASHTLPSPFPSPRPKSRTGMSNPAALYAGSKLGSKSGPGQAAPTSPAPHRNAAARHDGVPSMAPPNVSGNDETAALFTQSQDGSPPSGPVDTSPTAASADAGANLDVTVDLRVAAESPEAVRQHKKTGSNSIGSPASQPNPSTPQQGQQEGVTLSSSASPPPAPRTPAQSTEQPRQKKSLFRVGAPAKEPAAAGQGNKSANSSVHAGRPAGASRRTLLDEIAELETSDQIKSQTSDERRAKLDTGGSNKSQLRSNKSTKRSAQATSATKASKQASPSVPSRSAQAGGAGAGASTSAQSGSVSDPAAPDAGASAVSTQETSPLPAAQKIETDAAANRSGETGASEHSQATAGSAATPKDAPGNVRTASAPARGRRAATTPPSAAPAAQRSGAAQPQQQQRGRSAQPRVRTAVPRTVRTARSENTPASPSDGRSSTMSPPRKPPMPIEARGVAGRRRSAATPTRSSSARHAANAQRAGSAEPSRTSRKPPVPQEARVPSAHAKKRPVADFDSPPPVPKHIKPPLDTGLDITRKTFVRERRASRSPQMRRPAASEAVVQQPSAQQAFKQFPFSDGVEKVTQSRKVAASWDRPWRSGMRSVSPDAAGRGAASTSAAAAGAPISQRASSSPSPSHRSSPQRSARPQRGGDGAAARTGPSAADPRVPRLPDLGGIRRRGGVSASPRRVGSGALRSSHSGTVRRNGLQSPRTSTAFRPNLISPRSMRAGCVPDDRGWVSRATQLRRIRKEQVRRGTPMAMVYNHKATKQDLEKASTSRVGVRRKPPPPPQDVLDITATRLQPDEPLQMQEAAITRPRAESSMGGSMAPSRAVSSAERGSFPTIAAEARTQQNGQTHDSLPGDHAGVSGSRGNALNGGSHEGAEFAPRGGHPRVPPLRGFERRRKSNRSAGTDPSSSSTGLEASGQLSTAGHETNWDLSAAPTPSRLTPRSDEGDTLDFTLRERFGVVGEEDEDSDACASGPIAGAGLQGPDGAGGHVTNKLRRRHSSRQEVAIAERLKDLDEAQLAQADMTMDRLASMDPSTVSFASAVPTEQLEIASATQLKAVAESAAPEEEQQAHSAKFSDQNDVVAKSRPLHDDTVSGEVAMEALGTDPSQGADADTARMSLMSELSEAESLPQARAAQQHADAASRNSSPTTAPHAAGAADGVWTSNHSYTHYERSVDHQANLPESVPIDALPAHSVFQQRGPSGGSAAAEHPMAAGATENASATGSEPAPRDELYSCSFGDSENLDNYDEDADSRSTLNAEPTTRIQPGIHDPRVGRPLDDLSCDITGDGDGSSWSLPDSPHAALSMHSPLGSVLNSTGFVDGIIDGTVGGWAVDTSGLMTSMTEGLMTGSVPQSPRTTGGPGGLLGSGDMTQHAIAALERSSGDATAGLTDKAMGTPNVSMMTSIDITTKLHDASAEVMTPVSALDSATSHLEIVQAFKGTPSHAVDCHGDSMDLRI